MSGSSDKGWASRIGTHYKGAGFSFQDLQRDRKKGNGGSKINSSGICRSCGGSADCANNPNYCLKCWRKREFGGNYTAVFCISPAHIGHIVIFH